MIPVEYLATLKHISSEKKRLVGEIMDLTYKQNQILKTADENSDLLGKIIDEKQKVIRIIDQLDYDFSINYDALKESLGVKSLEGQKEEPVEGFKELQTTISGIISVMENIKLLDDENHKLATRNMEKIKGQLKNVKSSKKATSGYQKKYNENAALFVDKKR